MMRESTIKRKNIKYLEIDHVELTIDKDTVKGILKDGTEIVYRIVDED